MALFIFSSYNDVMRIQFALFCLTSLVLVSCGQPESSDCSDGIGCNDHRIFVSSQTYNGNFDGITGADASCQVLANAAGLSRTYKAILSDSSTNAVDRLAFTGAVYTVDGQDEINLVAKVGSDLWATDTVGNLLARIDYDEEGNSVTSRNPWTGSTGEGFRNDDFCTDNGVDWTSDSSSVEGDVGSTDFDDERWLENVAITSYCSEFNPIICISQ